MTGELISPGTRGRFRKLTTHHYLGEIDSAFQDEGFAPNTACTYADSSDRRTRAQEYLTAVDWTDPQHVERALRAMERITEDHDPEGLDDLRRSLGRDGYTLDEHGSIAPAAPDKLVLSSMTGLREPAAIIDNLERISRNADTDPAQVIGSAKELVESTAKTVLSQLGLSFNDKDDVQKLVSQAQQALKLHPSTTTRGPDGSDAVKKILGAAASLTTGVAELRNRGYGTGHGAGGRRTGLHPRHARLAVNAARTWCELILDTLADVKAPWRSPQDTAAPRES